LSASLAIVLTVVALVVGLALGYLIASLRVGREKLSLQIALEGERVRREAETQKESERITALEQSEARLRSAFDSLAGESLRANSEMFLRLAREALSRDQLVAENALKERETAISQLVEPLKTALERTEQQVQSIERERRDAFTSLRTQIEGLAGGSAQLQRETRNLVTALRRPEVRGRWGEMTLRRVVELAGMAEHCDFTEQLHLALEDGALRPDMVIHMPEKRTLVVDVKTPLDAYLEAIEAVTEETRGIAIKRHAQQVETRVRQLGSKSYWAQFQDSPEFAVLFLPGDQFLSAALAERPDLLDTALKAGVILATPSTLIALLKTVAYGWRQAAVAENAAQIHEMGQELYRRLNAFVKHLEKMGQQLNRAVDSYNSAVGSLERQVLPQARRFPELGVTADAPLPLLEPISQVARKTNAAIAEEKRSSGSQEPVAEPAPPDATLTESRAAAPSELEFATPAEGESATTASDANRH
jgi:DNA recombination protein RmuC